MIIVFVIIGAILASAIFQGLEFALLGGVIGYLTARLGQVSEQLKQLTYQVDKLKLTKSSSTVKPKLAAAPDNGEKQYQASPDLSPQKSHRQPEIKATYSGRAIFEPKEHSADIELNSTTQSENLKSTDVETSSFPQVETVNTHKSRQSHQPVQPDMVSRLLTYVVNYFTQGNVVVRVGAVILFFGIAFLVKYAAESNLIPIEVRLASVSLGGIGLLVFGWKFREKNQDYGLILQGTAVGVLYLTLFASFRLYQLVPASLAFPLLIAFSGLAMTLAVLQNARALAVLSVTGGFLAPVLASTGEGSHVALFSYYTILNLGIFAVAWFKAWRVLNLLGFAFTFIIGSAWGITKYQPENFVSSEFFLILFFLLYTAIALLFATKHQPKLKGYADATLIFGLPSICFSLQAAMVQDFEFGLAWSAFVLGAFYLLAAFLILQRERLAHLRVIAEAFVALGIIFTSLVIPFALDGDWTAASWAIEGAGLIWLGLKQDRWFAKYFGALIQLVGGIIFLSSSNFIRHVPNEVFLDAQLMGVIFVALGALFSSYQIWRYTTQPTGKPLKSFEATSRFVFLAWGLIWWYVGGLLEIGDYLREDSLIYALTAFLSITGIAFYLVERKTHWTMIANIIWITTGLSLLMGPLYLTSFDHLLTGYAGLGWLAILISIYWPLFDRDKRFLLQAGQSNVAFQLGSNMHIESKDDVTSGIKLPTALIPLHSLLFIGLFAISMIEANWLAVHYFKFHTTWQVSFYASILTLWIFALSHLKTWPIANFQTSYIHIGLSLMFASVFLWSVSMNFPLAGTPEPLSYLPIINPLDILQGILLAAVFIAMTKHQSLTALYPSALIRIVSAGTVSMWLNVILLRTIHAFTDTAYSPQSLFDSFLVQSSLSVFWTILALSGALLATRKQSRKLWIYAASLIGVVVAKLFLIDLANTGSIERIVSFVVVGLLLLTVGYFAPLPDKNIDLSNSEPTGK